MHFYQPRKLGLGCLLAERARANRNPFCCPVTRFWIFTTSSSLTVAAQCVDTDSQRPSLMWKCGCTFTYHTGSHREHSLFGISHIQVPGSLGNVSGDPKGNASKHSKNERQLLVQSASPWVMVIEFGNYNLLLLSGPECSYTNSFSLWCDKLFSTITVGSSKSDGLSRSSEGIWGVIFLHFSNASTVHRWRWMLCYWM